MILADITPFSIEQVLDDLAFYVDQEQKVGSLVDKRIYIFLHRCHDITKIYLFYTSISCKY